MNNHYKTLDVNPSATIDDIKTAYRKLAMKYHPDRNPGNKSAEERFKKINLAYEVLKDPQLRAQYNESFNKTTEKKKSFFTTHTIIARIIGLIIGGIAYSFAICVVSSLQYFQKILPTTSACIVITILVFCCCTSIWSTFSQQSSFQEKLKNIIKSILITLFIGWVYFTPRPHGQKNHYRRSSRSSTYHTPSSKASTSLGRPSVPRIGK